MTYVSGFVIPVKDVDKEAYLASARASGPMFKELGALAVFENWGADVRDGKLTDFKMAVKLEPGETVVFSWIVWPDRPTADAAEKAMMEDPRFEALGMPFDGKRMIVGGFETIYQI
jgi:uncharacterized protein YbaA (DUF1428 family)